MHYLMAVVTLTADPLSNGHNTHRHQHISRSMVIYRYHSLEPVRVSSTWMCIFHISNDQCAYIHVGIPVTLRPSARNAFSLSRSVALSLLRVWVCLCLCLLSLSLSLFLSLCLSVCFSPPRRFPRNFSHKRSRLFRDAARAGDDWQEPGHWRRVSQALCARCKC